MVPAGHATTASGASLVGLLVVLVILGASAAVVVAALPSTSSLTVPTTSTPTIGGDTTTTTSRSIPSAALVAACVADFEAARGAAQAYATINGVEPSAGTAWATSASRGGPFLRTWPAEPRQFALRWNGSSIVVVPAHGRASTGTAGTASPPTGCFAA